MEDESKTIEAPKPAFNAVMQSRDLAPLVLKRLDFASLIAYSHTYRLGYQMAKYYQWGKLLVEQKLVAYYLLEYVAFENRFNDAALRNLYLTLKNNRRFALAELSSKSVNFNFYATYGEASYIPWHFAALLGRIDIILDLVKKNPRSYIRTNEHILAVMKSQTNHRVVYYLVFAKQFDHLSLLFSKGYITKYDVTDSTVREELLFAGACAGVIDILEKLQKIYHCKLAVIKNEMIIIASGLIEGGHLILLTRLMKDHHLTIIEILSQHPECLHHAAENGHYEVVIFILMEIDAHNHSNMKTMDSEFQPIEIDSKGRSLLHYFCYFGWQNECLKMTTLSLKSVKPIEKRRSTFTLKSRKERVEKMVKPVLLSPTQADEHNKMPFHFALHGGKLSMIQFCLDQKWGDIKNVSDNCGNNALGIVIVEKQNHLIAPLILQYKIDWKCVNINGQNLLLVCASSNNWEAFVLLSQMKLGSVPLFKAPLDSKTLSGQTLAHVAANNGHIYFLRQLKSFCLKNGQSCYDQLFKRVDNKFNTILHRLCENYYYVGIFSLFVIEFGVDPFQVNREQENAVHHILSKNDKYSGVVWGSIAKIIQKHGMELMLTTNRERKTFTEIAKEFGKEELFKKSLGTPSSKYRSSHQLL